jgi:hypothetical protein
LLDLEANQNHHKNLKPPVEMGGLEEGLPKIVIHNGWVLKKLPGQAKWFRPVEKLHFRNGKWYGGRQYFSRKSCSFCGGPKYSSTTRKSNSKHCFCSKKCQNSFYTKENHPQWVGGYTDSNGYRKIRKSEHPNSKGGYVSEHIVVAEQMIGRLLNPEERVHHIDCDKRNNNELNLDVLTKEQHAMAHQSMNGLMKGLIAAGVVWFDRDRKIYRSKYGEIDIHSEDVNARMRNWRRSTEIRNRASQNAGLPSRAELLELLKTNNILIPCRNSRKYAQTLK